MLVIAPAKLKAMFPLTSVCRSDPGKERLYASIGTVRQMNVNTEMEISFLLELNYFAVNRTFKVCNSMVLRRPICVLKQIRVHWEANDTLHYLSQMFKIPLATGTSYTHCVFSHVSEHIPSELKQSIVT